MNEQRRLELERTLPTAEETRSRLREYLAIADMDHLQLAENIDYSVHSIRHFMHKNYKTSGAKTRTDVAIREAIEAYMASHPIGVPATSTKGRLYETENVKALRHWFDHCHRHQALAFAYGPPGSQKTFVLEHLVAEFNRRELKSTSSINRAYHIYCSIDIRPRDLIANICTKVGAPTGQSMQKCMANLRFHLRGTKTLIILDEAQHCGIRALEAIRELHDTEPRLGVLLAGSHQLKRFFSDHAAELEQWNSRIDAGVELEGVSESCARAIVKVEYPSLDSDQVGMLLENCWREDPYSSERNHRYLNVRRLFKELAALRTLEAEQEEAIA